MRDLLATIDLYDDDDTRIGLKRGGNFNPAGKNQFTSKMKTIEEIVKIKEANPTFRPKDFRGEGSQNDIKKGGKKLLTRDDIRRAQEAGIEFPTGKIKKKGDNRNVDRLALSKRRSSPSLETELAAPQKSKLNFHHAGFKESLTDLKNTMYIPGSPNRKMAKLFEDPLLKEMEAFTKVFDDPKATTKEKQKAATNYLKNDRALRQKYPQFKKFKTRLSFRRTAFGPGIMFKEKLPDPSLAISQEPGMTLKGETPTTPKGKEILKLGKDSLQKNLLQRYAAIGCGPKKAREGGRINFDAGASISCIRKGLEKVRSGDNLSPADRININKINNITKTAKGAKAAASAARILGAGVIAPEIVFGGFFAATDYATGANRDEIISNLTFGLGGKSMKEQLKESDPRYGQADKLTDVYQGYLSSLDKMGQPKQYVSRPGKRTTEQDVLQAMQPFTRVNPQLETGDFFDLGMYESQLEKDRAAEAKFAEDKIQRALERGFYDPGVGGSRRISEFQAAGGGIAKEAGDPSGAMLESMNPDSQGLSGLLKRVKKV